MRIGLLRPALLLSMTIVLGSVGARAQESAATPQNTPNSEGQQLTKKQARKLAKELGASYGEWIGEDVPEIITEEERKAFLSLSTNEEREQFIEIFWDRRKPDPESPTNTFREEHYRRLAYADEHFASGVRGRKTDRGRMYIIWGPPDEIETHPTGGTYDRPMEQGGGTTTTYPWELWRYRHLDGVGENIELEFVDPSGSGEYHLTMDPCEKDALSHVPGAGPSLSETRGQATRTSRFTNSNGSTCAAPVGGLSANGNEFDKMDRYFRVQRPAIHLKELEEAVRSRIVANQLPFQYRADFLRATSNTVLVPITVQVRNGDIRYEGKAGVQSAALEVYGQITSPGGKVVKRFEDVVSRDIPDSLFASAQNLQSIYQKVVPLAPGLYRLDIVIRDQQSGNIGTEGVALRVPRFDEEKLDASSLIIADQIEPATSREIGADRFLLNSYKVRPRLSQEYSGADNLGIFLQLYNLKLDDATHKTNLTVTYRILRGNEEVWRGVETPDHLHERGEQLTVERFISLSPLAPGRYTIEVIAIDLETNNTVTRSSEFTVKAVQERPEAPKTMSN